MKAIDYRNDTWDQIRGRLAGLREQVYQAYVSHGPGTTREIAERSGIDILTLRPRTTELLQLGFVNVLDVEDNGHEAVYVHVDVERAREMFEWAKRQPVQAELKLA